jgi:hypothetical protein
VELNCFPEQLAAKSRRARTVRQAKETEPTRMLNLSEVNADKSDGEENLLEMGKGLKKKVNLRRF